MHEDPPDPEGLHILVVDDNLDSAATLSALLEFTGHRVRTAHNGLDAVREALCRRFDAVLLDLGMPIMDGFEAAAMLRQLEPAPALIACSAWDDPETRRRTANLGFLAHLRKPIPYDLLKLTLRRIREATR